MRGTDRPPSTTSPARPPWARRALMIGLGTLTAVGTTIGLAETTGSTMPLAVLGASDAADATDRTGSDGSTSLRVEPDVAARITGLASIAATPFLWGLEAPEAAEHTEAAEPATEPATTSTTAAPITTTTAPPPPPPPPTTAPPTTASPQPAYGDPYDHATWDRLAGCESGGDWHIDTGNGYYGGLQFSLQSWQAVGGSGYPHEHPRETQIQMGIRLWEAQGWNAWPGCSRKLGYR